MQTIRNLAGRVRLIAVNVGLAAGVLCVSAAFAGPPLTINVRVDGVAGQDGNGNYSASSYTWGGAGAPEPKGASPQISFSQSLGSLSPFNGDIELELMNAVATHQKAATADVQVLCQTLVFIDYHMLNARFDSIGDHGFDFTVYPQQPQIGFSPLESVTLRFTGLVYTWQPILPNCQKNGPPVTYTWKF
jgi:hypothetical protein